MSASDPKTAPATQQLAEAARQFLSTLTEVLTTPRGLAALYVLAAILRLLVAPHFGFYPDLEVNQAMTRRMSEVGIADFFTANGGYSPPLPAPSLYFFWLIGTFSPNPGYFALKLPSLISDLALAWLAGSLASRLVAGTSTNAAKARLIVTAAVLFGPAILADGLLFGQNDSVPQVFAMGGFILLLTGQHSRLRDSASLLSFACAFGIEPQSVIYAPVVLYALVHRYVLIRNDRAERVRGTATILAAALPGTLLLLIAGLPFGLSPRELIAATVANTRLWSYTSSAAFNFWGIFAYFRKDYDFSLLWMPSRALGMVLFFTGVVFVIYRLHKAVTQGRTFATHVLWSSAAISLLGFTFLTRMHERYSFPAIVTITPLILWPSFRKYWATISIFFVANLWWPYTWFNGQWQLANPDVDIPGILRLDPWYTWLFGDPTWTINTPQRRLLAAFGVALCLVLVVRGTVWLQNLTTPTEPSVWSQRWRRLRQYLASTFEAQPSGVGSVLGTLRAARVTTYGSLAAVCVWWLGTLRDQLRAAPTLNDSTFHMQMVRWAESQLRDGRLALDGWFPDLTLGSAFFHNYQSLSYNITAVLSRLLPTDAESTSRWLLWLVVGTWPIAIYVSARLFDLRRSTAVMAAAASLALVSITGYGFELGSYIYGGYGIYTQMFGMWILPLAWATTWRALHRDGNLMWAALSSAITVALHFMTGYLAMVSIAVIALAQPTRRVFIRAGATIGASVAIGSWVLVPLLRDRHYSTVSEFYVNTLYYDSYGAGPIVRWLVSGSLFDEGRLPIITVLSALGAVVCILRWRYDSRCRALLLLAAASLVLFFGRVTLGSLTNLLPGNDTLQMHRFVAGVHLAAIFFAAIGATAVFTGVPRVLAGVRLSSFSTPWLGLAAAMAVGGIMLAPAYVERTNYTLRDNGYIDFQLAAEATDGKDLQVLLDIIKERNDGRAYAGTRANWGKDYKIGSVQVHQQFAHRDIDALGYTFRTMPSLSNDVEAYFDETNLAQFEMFNVKYIVMPSEMSPSVPAQLLKASGRHNLWEVQTTGYFDVVDRLGEVSADRSNLAQQTTDFRASDNALLGVYPGVSFNKRPVPPATTTEVPASPPGTLVSQSHNKQNGEFNADVRLDRPGVVLLKTTFDPHWKVTVDGEVRSVEFMAPSLVGVDVEAGEHTVRFTYQSFRGYPLLLAIGVATALGVWFVERRRIREATTAST